MQPGQLMKALTDSERPRAGLEIHAPNTVRMRGARGLTFASLSAAVLPLALVAAALFGVASAAASDAGGEKARQGEAIFKQRCIACHNKQPGDTSPFGPPNLSGIFHGPSAITTKQAAEIITNGKTTMPPFGTVLSKSDIDELIAYLKTK
jgi:mono/diheme cytochrome c family protein